MADNGSEVSGATLGWPPPEGWFGDPWRDGSLRWWDGSQWTGYTSPPPPQRDELLHEGALRSHVNDTSMGGGRKSPRHTDAQRARIWVVLIGGAFVLLMGMTLGLGNAASTHGQAVVVKEGPCVTTGDAGRVCDEHVEYRDGNRIVRAVMHGVHPDEVHGPPTHRTLAITFSHGDTGPPSTDDMPLWVPVGLTTFGVLLVVVGLLMRAGKWRAPGSTIPS